MPLTAALAPVEPSGDVWRRISDRLDRTARASSPAPGQRLSFWRGLTAFASVAAIGLAVLLANPRAVAPPVVVVLAATGGGGERRRDRTDRRQHQRRRHAPSSTRPIAPVAVRADRSLELWAVPTQGAPRSLGVLPGGSGVVALRGKVLAGADTLAVTIEPAGGSPTGAPTGPIVYAGKFAL